MAVQIRRATQSDIPELSRLVAALAAWEEALDPRARFDWDGIRDAPNWLRLVLNREHHAVWVAGSDARLVGHLWIRLKRNSDGAIPQSIGYISQAFMEENFRGRGLMKPMLEEAYEWFRDAGITVVTLSVLHRNWIGATAWRRLGFSDWREDLRMDLKPRPK
ncbi:GNAT family N-acetyltransferase [Candidatus Binatus sp.]|jgi:GNAT superfamily N-acetyltransferase|uniref:GNAT family N-acetyltransferase n=1 Tax=Candidatus Binatus sp. TaxID=2811406 RepID=UPI002FD87C2C